MHVGKGPEDFRCQDLAVDKWAEVEIKCPETGEIEKEDIFDGKQTMEEKEEERLRDALQGRRNATFHKIFIHFISVFIQIKNIISREFDDKLSD